MRRSRPGRRLTLRWGWWRGGGGGGGGGGRFGVGVGWVERAEVIRWSRRGGRRVYGSYALVGGGAEGPGGGGAVLLDPYVESEEVLDRLLGLLGRRPVA